MKRRPSPLFLRVSIGLGLATAVLTSAARANPAMISHLGFGQGSNASTSAQSSDGALRSSATGQSQGSGSKPSTPSGTTTVAPRIGRPVAETAQRPSLTRRPEQAQPGHPPQPSKTQPSKTQQSKTQQVQQSELVAISAAAKTERSSWSQVQKLVRHQPTLADTPLLHEIVQFQKTVPTASELTSPDGSASSTGNDALTSQTPKERQLLLRNLITQNVVLQTLLHQAAAANLNG